MAQQFFSTCNTKFLSLQQARIQAGVCTFFFFLQRERYDTFCINYITRIHTQVLRVYFVRLKIDQKINYFIINNRTNRFRTRKPLLYSGSVYGNYFYDVQNWASGQRIYCVIRDFVHNLHTYFYLIDSLVLFTLHKKRY